MDSSATPRTKQPKSGEKSKQLVSDRRVKVIAAKDAIDPAEDALVLAPWFMASLSLPYREPASDLMAWERVNGKHRITITPYVKDGKAYFPYGVYPRLLITFLTTEAVKTDSSTIQIADGLRGFMRQLGLNAGGKQKQLLLDQMQRLFNASIRIETVEEVIRDGVPLTHVVTKNFQFTEEHELWLKGSNGEVQAIEWGSSVTLSPKFYDSLKGQSFPVFAEALKAVGNSPFALDIYLFLVSRLYRLKRRTSISWDQLNQQFGGNYKEIKTFKHAFLRNLQTVQIIYPEAKIVVDEKCLTLLPSKQHVPSRESKQAIEGTAAS